MTDTPRDHMIDSLSEDLETNPDSPPQAHEDAARSDIEQAVEARSDAIERGEGGDEPDPMTSPGDHSGNRGTGGIVRNQDDDQQ